jgi:hypothetical protein
MTSEILSLYLSEPGDSSRNGSVARVTVLSGNKETGKVISY